MRSPFLHPTVRKVLRARPVPVALLVAAAVLGGGGGPAQAAGSPDFQYLGQDDQAHGLTAPKGCVRAAGGGARAVTNRTGGTATLYREPGCKGRAVQVLPSGTVTQVRPAFASVRFDGSR
ncbi:hypothetical protein KPP03845_106705 [Streptomyces xanthophaeus]|uniref:hypothetical protein n=1 Tax=Streptomyces xanthophaeus TaxID=67385 RepID=UPI00233EC14F|nr:hypothetical protein [Streptomyces xanthophaeus]WCD90278.1 hypothetical protein KPP03845_106705 [Streptomyces xanthophaeus]